MAFGNSKTMEWLLSIGISTANNVLFAQPLKIIIVSLITALLFKCKKQPNRDAYETENQSEENSSAILSDRKIRASNKLSSIGDKQNKSARQNDLNVSKEENGDIKKSHSANNEEVKNYISKSGTNIQTEEADVNPNKMQQNE